LRWELKERAGFDPREVEGMPELAGLRATHGCWSSKDADDIPALVDYLVVDSRDIQDWERVGHALARRVASRVTVRVRHFDAEVVRRLCGPIAQANPTICWDIVVDGDAPEPSMLRRLHADWPHATGYLDRIAVYERIAPEPPYGKATPRFVLLAPWGTALDPLRYEGIARIFWRLDPSEADLQAVAASGGAGIVVGEGDAEVMAKLACWSEEHGLVVWTEDGATTERNHAIVHGAAFATRVAAD
jgi:hypothetical protein